MRRRWEERKRVMRRWGLVRRQAILIVWVKLWKEVRREEMGRPEAFAGRGWRPARAVNYREARPYNKRQAREGGEARGERVVWRKSRGAEIGVVMLMKLEGKRPMVRAKTKKKEGADG